MAVTISSPPESAIPHPVIHTQGCRVSPRFDSEAVQSAMNPDEPTRLKLEYTRAMMMFLLCDPAPPSILMIGLGAGSLPKYCHRHLPDCDITVVEINQAVIALHEVSQVPPASGVAGGAPRNAGAPARRVRGLARSGKGGAAGTKGMPGKSWRRGTMPLHRRDLIGE